MYYTNVVKSTLDKQSICRDVWATTSRQDETRKPRKTQSTLNQAFKTGSNLYFICTVK